MFTTFYSTSLLESVFVLMTLAASRLSASGDFFRLLIIFSSYLNPDHDGHSIGFDPNCWTSDDFLKLSLKKVSSEKLPSMQKIKSAIQINILNSKKKNKWQTCLKCRTYKLSIQ